MAGTVTDRACRVCRDRIATENRRAMYCSEACKAYAYRRFSVGKPVEMGTGRNGKRRHRLAGCVFGRLTVVRKTTSSGASRWLCVCDCGTEKVVGQRHLLDGRTRSCGCLAREVSAARTGEQHPAWKGGRAVRIDGYVELHMPRHPNAGTNGRVREHVAVMSEVLGRGLLPNEQVHHKNGIRSDNALGNLELWTVSHPAGQRVSDMIEFCHSYLAQYAPHLLGDE